MKKLLFVIPEYSHGGTNKSLESFLSFIDKDKYKVAIFCLFEDGGPYYKDLFRPFIVKKSLLYYWVHDNWLTRKLFGFIYKAIPSANSNWLYKYEANRIQNKYDFDTVVAFQECTSTDFVSYIKTEVNKIAWIHCDFSVWAEGKDKLIFEDVYRRFNHVVCVSETAKSSFLGLYPKFTNRTHCIYNTLDVSTIRTSSKSKFTSFDLRNNCFNILSVGRFATVKQFHLIPKLAAEIKKITNTPFCWYIMGSGCELLEQISSEITKYQVDNEVVIIPAQDNPYPYISKADLYVCTSSSESFSYTIAESKILHTPVVSNDFPVAYEVIDDTTGWVCNIEKMPQLIADIINNKDDMYTKKVEAIRGYQYDNAGIIQAFEGLL